MTTTTTINVENVATEAELADEIGGMTELLPLLPKDAPVSLTFRQKALEETIKVLSRRTPPIRDADISIPKELRDCVVYGALARIYENNMTQGNPDSLWTKKAQTWRDRYISELSSLQPTLGDDVRGPSMSMTVHRR